MEPQLEEKASMYVPSLSFLLIEGLIEHCVVGYTYLIWAVALTLVILLSVFQNNIINWIQPAVSKMKS